MAHISTKDAIRLGLITADAADSARKPKPGAISTRSRPRRKGGRRPRAADCPIFDMTITIPFEPRTKHRARTSLSKQAILKAFHQARGNAQRFSSLLDSIPHTSFTPKETADFEKSVATIAMAAMRGKPPYDHPLIVDVAFILNGEEDLWPTDVTDPDIDNMAKAVFDAFNKIVWSDDRLVICKSSVKLCAQAPKIVARIRDAASHPNLLPQIANSIG